MPAGLRLPNQRAVRLLGGKVACDTAQPGAGHSRLRIAHTPSPTIDMLSPTFIVRLSGLPASVSESLSTAECRVALRKFLTANARSIDAARAASDELYGQIGGEADVELRALLLRVRRALFNCRLPSERDRGTLRSMVMGRAVSDAITALEERELTREDVRALFGAATQSARSSLRQALSNDRLRLGVLASSASLYGNLARYLSRDARSLTARDLQIERGVLRYLTRASMKATPFGSFCTIIEGALTAGDAGATDIAGRVYGSTSETMRLVRLNKSLFGILWECLKADEDSRRWLAVDVNPTLIRSGEQYLLLASQNQLEVFQRLNASEAVDIVIRALQVQPGLRLNELAALLQSDARVEAEAKETEQFVVELLRIGLLRFRNPVRALEGDWLCPMAGCARAIPSVRASVIAAFCETAERELLEFRDSGAEARERIMARLVSLIRHTLKEVGASERVTVKTPIFEDWGANARYCLPRTIALDDAERRLRTFVERILPIAYPRLEMATMRAFADSYYTPNWNGVSLLQFYEDFYREHFRDHLQHLEDARRVRKEAANRPYDVNNPMNLEVSRRILATRAAWQEAIRNAWAISPDAVEVSVRPEDVVEIGGLDACVTAGGASVALFAQLVPVGEGERALRILTNAGTVFLGYGKYFSRFLDLCRPAVTAAVLDANTVNSSPILAEIGGDANFNANLHPKIVPFELAYPTVDGDVTGKAITCDAIEVRPDPENVNALALFEVSSERRVVPLDLGFLNPQRRPALYQLLSRFAPIGSFSLLLPSMPSRSADERTATAIVYRPRLLYDGRIILARRRWTIPGSLYPQRASGEQDAEYYIRLNAWRAMAGLPERGYVRIAVHTQTPSTGDAVGVDGEIDTDLADAEEVAEANRSVSSEEQVTAHEAISEGHVAVRKRVNAMQGGADQKPGRTAEGTSRDYAKPQYIDFTSPLLADLFGRLPVSLNAFTAYFEEQHPEPTDQPCIDGLHHPCEMVFQLDWPAYESPVAERSPSWT